MKKVFVTYMLLVGIMLLTACNDFLQEKYHGKLFPEGFYSDENELELGVVSFMRPFNRAFHSDYDTFVNVMHGGDDSTVPYPIESKDQGHNDTFFRQAGNEHSVKGWNNAFNTINNANALINNYMRAEGTMSEEKLNQYAALARFARGYIYYWLVRVYNEIPYVESARIPDRTISLSTPEYVYDRIIEDLKFAEQWLPTSWASIDQVKHNGAAFTKGAAKATLASVYLTMAGFPVNKTEYYAFARDKAKELIDGVAQGDYRYRLLEHHADLWSFQNRFHDEMVLSVVYSKTTADYNARGGAPQRPVQLGGWEMFCSEVNFFHRFPNGERKDATFVTLFPFTPEVAGNPMSPVPPNPSMPLANWSSWERMFFRHPYFKKMWDIDNAEGDNRWKVLSARDYEHSRTNQLIRYAEVLMIYAEAQAMADGAPNDLAYDCVNLIRNRAFAGLNSTGKELQRGLSASAFRDSVFVERGWEFTSEFANRYFDLMRLELVEDAHRVTPVNKFLPGRAAAETRITGDIRRKDYWFLIPEDETLLNPNLLNQNQQYDYVVQ